MKKLFALILCILLQSVPMSGKDGDKFTISNIRYQVISESEKTCQVGWGDKFSNYTKAVADNYSGEIDIPAYANGYKVVSINPMAFRVLNYVTSVSIPYTVNYIGENAFYNSKNLKTVYLNCSELSNPYDPFKGNPVIEQIILGDSVKSVGLYMFQDCTGLSSISLGKNIKSIEPKAFAGCTSLKSIKLPESLESIFQEAFRNCSNITSISIPGNVTYITVNAFLGCSTLEKVYFQDSDKTLLIGVTTDNASKNIIMFNDCPLDFVHLGRNIQLGSANYSPFRNNKTLKNVWLGKLVTELPKGVFYGCKNLEIASTTTFEGTIPISVFYAPLRSISSNAFNGCISLKSFILSTTVTEIAENAFCGCTSLERIYIPEGSTMTQIADNAFRECTSLKEVYIPEGVRSIGGNAFFNSGLENVSIPKTINQIGNFAFANSKLKKVDIMERTVNDKATIGYGVFQSCELLDSVYLTPSMTIDKYLFSGCKNLKTVRLPNLISEIPDGTFQGCISLPEFNIKTDNIKVTKIGYEAFRGCENLKKVVLPEQISELSTRAFQNCSSLEGINLPDSLKAIGAEALENCSSLKTLTIPNTVTSIGKNIIAGCTSLKELISFSSSYIDVIPTQPCVALMAPSVIDRYNKANIRPLVTLEATQSSVILKSTTDFDITTANQISGQPKEAENGEVKLYGLAPNKQLKVHIEGTAFNRHVAGNIDVTTKPMQLDITLEKATNLTLHLKGICNNGDATIIESDFGDYGTGDEAIITGLKPGQDVNVTYKVKTIDGSVSSCSKRFSTIPVTASVRTDVGSTSCVLTGSYSIIDATLTNSGFYENDFSSDILKVNGLDPNIAYNNKYSYMISTKEGGTIYQNVSFRTNPLQFTTMQSKVVTPGNVIVAAQSNIDDEEENVGFEWRRTDWTDEFPSNTGTAYLYEGEMEGYIRNLNTEKLWKFRPYYESATGNRYYGEWMGLDPTNTSYFEPTVHTYAQVSVQGNIANVQGYAMRGSDNTAEQGFKYWEVTASSRAMAPGTGSVPSNAQTVTANGIVMQASLTNLDYETTYCYVAFVTTTEGETFYGDMRQFTTDVNPAGIEESVADKAVAIPVAYYDLNGRHLQTPQSGLIIARMSDGTSRKMIVK